MSPSDLASQLPYVLAPVLVCSALLKRVMQMKEDRLKLTNESRAKNISWSDILSKVRKDFSIKRSFWRFELVLAIFVIVLSMEQGFGRYMSNGLMVITFGSFFVLCIADLKRAKQSPCFCFGSLSKKPPRLVSCARNLILCGLSVVGTISQPATVSILGVVVCVVVLGAILLEEIR